MTMEELKKYYVTFGFGQIDNDGNSLANCYTVIIARNRQEAQVKAIEYFGMTWSMLYSSKEKAGVEEHGLKLINYPKVKKDGEN